jgi:hypothetical protein
MDNFSIQDTMQMGMGNTSFRGSLDSGAASKPDTLEPIVKKQLKITQ